MRCRHRDRQEAPVDRDDRPLKQREIGETRVEPSSPELTAMLHHHIATFGTAKDGRLFVGQRSSSNLPSPHHHPHLGESPR
ncbi:MAG: hypothetical protein ACRD0W_19900 [Acidimicrobiales bacterium]